MPRGHEALVEASLLLWGRKSAGLSIEEAARKTAVSPERVTSWERGDSRPTISQLRKLGQAYKRPIAVFFLPEPPKDFDALRDFRRFPDGGPVAISPELRYEIRRSFDRREIALDLFEATETEPPEFTGAASLGEDPEDVGQRIRALLSVSHEAQASWSKAHQAFGEWRGALERAGLLVFQARGVETSEMRGFSIAATTLPVVVVNRRDFPRSRIFTMIHELGHVVVSAGGLCDLEEAPGGAPEDEQLEAFCNHVAGAVLVPARRLESESIIIARGSDPELSDTEIEALAETYTVTREVLVRRLLTLGRTTRAFYVAKRKQYEQERLERESPKTDGFLAPAGDALSAEGKAFVRLVLDAYYQEAVTASDAADYLGVRLKHLPKIEEAILPR